MGLDFGKALMYAGTGGLSAFTGGGGLFGGDDDKGEAMKRLLEQMQRAQAAANVKAEGYGVRGLHELLGGYDQAINNVARTGAASRTQAIGAGQRANASLGQSLMGRGLYNTSALEGGRAQNLGATSQALASIDQSVANAKAGLQSARGQAAQGGYQALSSLADRYGQQQMMPLQAAYQSAASAPTQMEQIMQLLKGVGQFAPMMFGMPPMPKGTV